MPDTDTLHSLVRASPGYHQAYFTVREKLLGSLVRRQYDKFLDLAEALTAVRSKTLHFTTQRERAISLLDSWRRRNEIRHSACKTLSKSIHEPDGLEEIIDLLHFHKMLNFFLTDFSIHAPRPPWIETAQWEKQLPLHLTVLEKQRFLKALCRFQVLANIFGDTYFHRDYNKKVWQLGDAGRAVDGSSEAPVGTIEMEVYRMLYGPMLPWEHDEMGSVLGYLISKIAAICADITDDLRQLMKRTPGHHGWFYDILPVEQRPPIGEVECERDLDNFHWQFPGLASLGPEFLHDILHMDWLTRRNIIIENTRPFWAGPFIGEKVYWLHARFPCLEPADRYTFQDFEELWLELPPLEQASVGWKKTWLLPPGKDDDEDLEDCMRSNRDVEKNWEWSYALWDEKRLQEWEAPLLLPDDEVPATWW